MFRRSVWFGRYQTDDRDCYRAVVRGYLTDQSILLPTDMFSQPGTPALIHLYACA